MSRLGDDDTQVSWQELRDGFGPGVVAHGRHLRGVVSFRDDENWASSPNVRLCDAAGEDAAVFFYTSLAPRYDLDALHLGDVVCLRSPRLHWFADRQYGVRVDDVTQVAAIEPGHMTPAQRLHFATLMRDKGGDWVGLREWERAAANYAGAARLLSYHADLPNDDAVTPSRLRASVLSNLCLCHLQLRRWHEVLAVGAEALSLLPVKDAPQNAMLRAKVCYRVALAAEQLRDFGTALPHAAQADQLLHAQPDAAVTALHRRLRNASAELGTGWRSVLRERQGRTRLPGMLAGFGRRTDLFSSPDVTSDSARLGAALRSAGYVVDVAELHASATSAGRLRRDVLYASGDVTGLTPREVHFVRHTLGIKTYVCLRLGFGPGWQLRSLRKATRCVVVPASERRLPSDVPVMVECDLLRALLPWWLYGVLALCHVLGACALCDRVVRFWCFAAGAGRRRACVARLARPLHAVLQPILADPAQYPVLLVGNSRVGEAWVLSLLLRLLGDAPLDHRGRCAVAEAVHVAPECVPELDDVQDAAVCSAAAETVRALLAWPCDVARVVDLDVQHVCPHNP